LYKKRRIKQKKKRYIYIKNVGIKKNYSKKMYIKKNYRKKITKNANGYKKRAHTHTKGHGPKTPAGLSPGSRARFASKRANTKRKSMSNGECHKPEEEPGGWRGEFYENVL